MEVWKDIDGYEGRYQVSNFGNVKSLNYRRQGVSKLLTPKRNNSGRLWVELFNEDGKRQFLIHRLVGAAFVPNPDGYDQINHIDENPENNRADNLEWCTGIYNIRSYRSNHPELSKRRKCNLSITQYAKDGSAVRTWASARDVEKETNWSAWSIAECCRGNRKTAYGYIWRYAN